MSFVRMSVLGFVALAYVVAIAGCVQEEASPPSEDGEVVDVLDAGPDILDDTPLDLASDLVEDSGSDLAPELPAPPAWAWMERSLGDVGEIRSMVALSTTEAYAISGPRVLRYNGVVWASFGEPTGEDLYGITALAGEVIVCGAGGLVARRQAGTMLWESEDAGVDVKLYALASRPNGELVAVGEGSTIIHFSPSAGWSSEHSGGSVSLRSVWTPPGGEGLQGTLAVGTKGTLYRHAGDGWVSEQIAAGDVTLYGVLGAGERRFAVGTSGTISVRETSSSPWQGATSNLTDGWDLHALAALGPNEVRAFGDQGSVIAYDGNKWLVEGVSGPHHVLSDLRAASVRVDPEGGAPLWMALADEGGGLVQGAESWVDVSTRPDTGFRALAGTSRDNLWGVGPGGLVMGSGSQGWTVVDSGTTENLNDVVHGPAGGVYIAGDGATLLSISPEGVVAGIAVPAVTDLIALGVLESKVVLGGKGGTVLVGDLETQIFEFWNTGMAWDVHAVTADSEGSWWLAGGFGSLRRSTDGEATEVIQSPASGALRGLMAWGDTMLVVGDNGAILGVGPEGATFLAPEQPASFLYDVHAHGAVAWAVGYPGVALMDDGQGWVETPMDSKVWLEAVWSDEEGAIVAGRSGTLFQWSEVP